MTSIYQKRFVVKEKHNLFNAKLKERLYCCFLGIHSSSFRSPRRIWDQDPTLLSEYFVNPSVSNSCHNFVTNEISVLEAYDVEKEESSHEESQPQLSLLSGASPSHYISRTNEYTLVLKPPFGQYEIIPTRGMSLTLTHLQQKSGEAKRQTLCNQFEEKDDLTLNWFWMPRARKSCS
ncbi:hypothetical protein YC2023_099692 [Brassica napus]